MNMYVIYYCCCSCTCMVRIDNYNRANKLKERGWYWELFFNAQYTVTVLLLVLLYYYLLYDFFYFHFNQLDKIIFWVINILHDLC